MVNWGTSVAGSREQRLRNLLTSWQFRSELWSEAIAPLVAHTACWASESPGRSRAGGFCHSLISVTVGPVDGGRSRGQAFPAIAELGQINVSTDGGLSSGTSVEPRFTWPVGGRIKGYNHYAWSSGLPFLCKYHAAFQLHVEATAHSRGTIRT